ncbi:hypothetical protein Q1695_000676 [Nippostrongylus brasiliensis]|nr:hypothetical protein Q1695_000676 [Nippostrongylus brasiliensis]
MSAVPYFIDPEIAKKFNLRVELLEEVSEDNDDDVVFLDEIKNIEVLEDTSPDIIVVEEVRRTVPKILLRKILRASLECSAKPIYTTTYSPLAPVGLCYSVPEIGDNAARAAENPISIMPNLQRGLTYKITTPTRSGDGLCAFVIRSETREAVFLIMSTERPPADVEAKVDMNHLFNNYGRRLRSQQPRVVPAIVPRCHVPTQSFYPQYSIPQNVNNQFHCVYCHQQQIGPGYVNFPPLCSAGYMSFPLHHQHQQQQQQQIPPQSMMHPGGNYRDVHFGTTHQACQAQDLNVQVANVQEQHSNDAMQQQLMNLSINNNDVSQENGGYTIVQNGEDVQQQSVCVDMDNGENRGCINAPEFQDVESNPNYDAKSQEKADEFLRQLLEEEARSDNESDPYRDADIAELERISGLLDDDVLYNNMDTEDFTSIHNNEAELITETSHNLNEGEENNQEKLTSRVENSMETLDIGVPVPTLCSTSRQTVEVKYHSIDEEASSAIIKECYGEFRGNDGTRTNRESTNHGTCNTQNNVNTPMFNDENLRNDLAKLIELRKQHAKYAKQLAAVDEFMEWDAKLTRFEKMAAELFDFNAKFVHEEWNKKMAEAIQLLQSLRSGPYGTDTNIQWDVLTHPQTSVTLEQNESQQEDRIGNGDVVMEDDDRLQEPQHPTSDSPPTIPSAVN